MQLPEISHVPLFKEIPIRVIVICESQPLPDSSKDDVSSFKFPRNPKLTDIDLHITTISKIRSRGRSRTKTEDVGLVGGFGIPKDETLHLSWGTLVQTEVTPPVWVPEDQGHGRWRESIMFRSTVKFSCSPPISTSLIESKVSYMFVVGYTLTS